MTPPYVEAVVHSKYLIDSAGITTQYIDTIATLDPNTLRFTATYTSAPTPTVSLFDFRTNTSWKLTQEELQCRRDFATDGFYSRCFSSRDAANPGMNVSISFGSANKPATTYSLQLYNYTSEYTKTSLSEEDHADVTRIMLIGYPTKSDDLPTSLTAGLNCYSYNTGYQSSYAPGDTHSSPLYLSPNPVKINYDTGTITFEFIAYKWIDGSYQRLESVKLDGKIYRESDTFNGTISSEKSGFSGSFFGKFYGPRGQEVQALFKIRWSNQDMIGHITCK